MPRDRSDLVLRAGLAFAFLYPPLDAIVDPNSWIGYFPHAFLLASRSAHVPDLVLLHGFGALEIAIALWILSGRAVFWPACAAALILLAIVLTDLADFQIIFRDLSIAALALALMIRHAPVRRASAYGNA